MDPTLIGEQNKSGKGRVDTASSSRGQGSGRGGRASGRGGKIAIQRAQQAILRGMGQANVLQSRGSTPDITLCITGLSQSKAATNNDGGLEALVTFLERKGTGLDAKSNRAVRIKKVCTHTPCL